MLHIIKVLNVNILLLITLISSSAFNTEKCSSFYVAVFTTPIEWNNSNVSSLLR